MISTVFRPRRSVLTLRVPGQYHQFNQAHVNIHEAAAHNDKYSGGRFVRDDKSEMLIICGLEKNLQYVGNTLLLEPR